MTQTLHDQRQNPYSFDGSAAPARSGILPDDTVYWIPTDGATLHNGKPIPATMSFPFLPHEEIGEVVSAYSNFDSRKIFGFNRRLYQRYAKIIFFLSIFGFQILAHLATSIGTRNYLISAGILVFTIVFLYALRWVKPPPECTYVGLNGYVRWYRKQKAFYQELVLFKDCSHNSFKQVLSENRGKYAGAFVFNLVMLDGTRHEYETHMDFSAIGPFDMGLSIDLAWTKYLLRNARAKIEAGGYFDIRADRDLVIRFFSHHVEIIYDWRSIKVTKQELTLFRFAYDMNIKFFIRADLAPGRNGEFLLPFSEIHNYRAFMILVSHVLETKLEGKKFDPLPAWHLGTW